MHYFCASLHKNKVVFKISKWCTIASCFSATSSSRRGRKTFWHQWKSCIVIARSCFSQNKNIRIYNQASTSFRSQRKLWIRIKKCKRSTCIDNQKIRIFEKPFIWTSGRYVCSYFSRSLSRNMQQNYRYRSRE